ncbi:hypothetical protein LINPERHAP2_LOCUS14820 [Linum perenne]
MRITTLSMLSSTAIVLTILLSIWAEWGGAISLVVSNKQIGLENAIYVKCYNGLNETNLERIFPEKEVNIQVGGQKEREGKQQGSFCIGTYTKFYGMGASPYYIYDSGKTEFDQYCDESAFGCRVMANQTSFYRWDLQNKRWDLIQASMWLH